MTLDEYTAKLRVELDDFAADYRQQHARAPNTWPLTGVDESEWDEQFMFWCLGKDECPPK